MAWNQYRATIGIALLRRIDHGRCRDVAGELKTKEIDDQLDDAYAKEKHEERDKEPKRIEIHDRSHDQSEVVVRISDRMKGRSADAFVIGDRNPPHLISTADKGHGNGAHPGMRVG